MRDEARELGLEPYSFDGNVLGADVGIFGGCFSPDIPGGALSASWLTVSKFRVDC